MKKRNLARVIALSLIFVLSLSFAASAAGYTGEFEGIPDKVTMSGTSDIIEQSGKYVLWGSAVVEVKAGLNLNGWIFMDDSSKLTVPENTTVGAIMMEEDSTLVLNGAVGELYLVGNSTVTFGTNSAVTGVIYVESTHDIEISGSAINNIIAGPGNALDPDLGQIIVHGTLDADGNPVTNLQVWRASTETESAVIADGSFLNIETRDLEGMPAVVVAGGELTINGTEIDFKFSNPVFQGDSGYPPIDVVREMFKTSGPKSANISVTGTTAAVDINANGGRVNIFGRDSYVSGTTTLETTPLGAITVSNGAMVDLGYGKYSFTDDIKIVDGTLHVLNVETPIDLSLWKAIIGCSSESAILKNDNTDIPITGEFKSVSGQVISDATAGTNDVTICGGNANIYFYNDDSTTTSNKVYIGGGSHTVAGSNLGETTPKSELVVRDGEVALSNVTGFIELFKSITVGIEGDDPDDYDAHVTANGLTYVAGDTVVYPSGTLTVNTVVPDNSLSTYTVGNSFFAGIFVDGGTLEVGPSSYVTPNCVMFSNSEDRISHLVLKPGNYQSTTTLLFGYDADDYNAGIPFFWGWGSSGSDATILLTNESDARPTVVARNGFSVLAEGPFLRVSAEGSGDFDSTIIGLGMTVEYVEVLPGLKVAVPTVSSIETSVDMSELKDMLDPGAYIQDIRDNLNFSGLPSAYIELILESLENLVISPDMNYLPPVSVSGSAVVCLGNVDINTVIGTAPAVELADMTDTNLQFTNGIAIKAEEDLMMMVIGEAKVNGHIVAGGDDPDAGNIIMVGCMMEGPESMMYPGASLTISGSAILKYGFPGDANASILNATQIVVRDNVKIGGGVMNFGDITVGGDMVIDNPVDSLTASVINGIPQLSLEQYMETGEWEPIDFEEYAEGDFDFFAVFPTHASITVGGYLDTRDGGVCNNGDINVGEYFLCGSYEDIALFELFMTNLGPSGSAGGFLNNSAIFDETLYINPDFMMLLTDSAIATPSLNISGAALYNDAGMKYAMAVITSDAFIRSNLQISAPNGTGLYISPDSAVCIWAASGSAISASTSAIYNEGCLRFLDAKLNISGSDTVGIYNRYVASSGGESYNGCLFFGDHSYMFNPGIGTYDDDTWTPHGPEIGIRNDGGIVIVYSGNINATGTGVLTKNSGDFQILAADDDTYPDLYPVYIAAGDRAIEIDSTSRWAIRGERAWIEGGMYSLYAASISACTLGDYYTDDGLTECWYTEGAPSVLYPLSGGCFDGEIKLPSGMTVEDVIPIVNYYAEQYDSGLVIIFNQANDLIRALSSLEDSISDEEFDFLKELYAVCIEYYLAYQDGTLSLTSSELTTITNSIMEYIDLHNEAAEYTEDDLYESIADIPTDPAIYEAQIDDDIEAKRTYQPQNSNCTLYADIILDYYDFHGDIFDNNGVINVVGGTHLIDLNGHSIRFSDIVSEGAIIVSGDAELTLTGGGIVQRLFVDGEDAIVSVSSSVGALTMTNGAIYVYGGVIGVDAASEINGGVICTTDDAIFAMPLNIRAGADLLVLDGYFGDVVFDEAVAGDAEGSWIAGGHYASISVSDGAIADLLSLNVSAIIDESDLDAAGKAKVYDLTSAELTTPGTTLAAHDPSLGFLTVVENMITTSDMAWSAGDNDLGEVTTQGAVFTKDGDDISFGLAVITTEEFEGHEFTFELSTDSGITLSCGGVEITSTTAVCEGVTVTAILAADLPGGTYCVTASSIQNPNAAIVYEIVLNAAPAIPITDSSITITVSPTSYVYDGTEKQPTITVKRNGTPLTAGVDYTCGGTWKATGSETSDQTYTITIIGLGNYTGMTTKQWKITKKPVTPAPTPTPGPFIPSGPAVPGIDVSAIFTDVSTNDYFFDAVYWALKNKVITANEEKLFRPNTECLRADMVYYMWKAAGSPVLSGELTFVDVKKDSKYYNAILWAYELGITKGYNADYFGILDPVTRGQSMTFLARMFGVDVNTGEYSHSFADVPADMYCNNAVAWGVTQGITEGRTATIFAPNDLCTNAHIITYLYRALN